MGLCGEARIGSGNAGRRSAGEAGKAGNRDIINKSGGLCQNGWQTLLMACRGDQPNNIQTSIACRNAKFRVSIWVLAVELSRPGRESRLWQRPWYLAGGFGLLHGMGFAGALAETGLPQLYLPTALLFFNLGIEAGQLTFIALLTGVGLVVTRFSRATWLSRAPVYVLGAVSTFWVLDRTSALFG